MQSRTEHKSFLVCFHRGQGQRHWRTTLQDVRSDQVIQFESEQELVRALLHLLATVPADKDISTPEV